MTTNLNSAEDQYQFYLENCIDEENGDIPLSLNEWCENHLEECQDYCNENNINL